MVTCVLINGYPYQCFEGTVASTSVKPRPWFPPPWKQLSHNDPSQEGKPSQYFVWLLSWRWPILKNFSIYLPKYTVPPSKLTRVRMSVILILEVPGSNLGRDTKYPKISRGFPRSVQAHAVNSRPWRSRFSSFVGYLTTFPVARLNSIEFMDDYWMMNLEEYWRKRPWPCWGAIPEFARSDWIISRKICQASRCSCQDSNPATLQ